MNLEERDICSTKSAAPLGAGSDSAMLTEEPRRARHLLNEVGCSAGSAGIGIGTDTAALTKKLADYISSIGIGGI